MDYPSLILTAAIAGAGASVLTCVFTAILVKVTMDKKAKHSVK